MIDVQKMRDAFAATPDLKPGKWVQYAPAGQRGGVCAVSALLIHAGVSYELLRSLAHTMGSGGWLETLARPVLAVAYGISLDHAKHIVCIFDRTPNEWDGVRNVIAFAESVNAQAVRTSEVGWHAPAMVMVDEMAAVDEMAFCADVHPKYTLWPKHSVDTYFEYSGLKSMAEASGG